jgi:hypothetical protein
MARWYVQRPGSAPVGPIDAIELREAWGRGEIPPHTMVCADGFSQWVPFHTIGELVGPLAPAPTSGPKAAPPKRHTSSLTIAFGILAAIAVLLAGVLWLRFRKTSPTAMEVCKNLEATGQFSGCVVRRVPGGERCPDQVEFSFTTKPGTASSGAVFACASNDEYGAALDYLNLHPYRSESLLDASPERRIIVYYGPAMDVHLKPEQLNAISVALGEKPFRPVHSAACDAKGSCKSAGNCSVIPGDDGNCLAGSDDDCKQADVCTQYGMCKLGSHGLCR